MPVSGQKAGGRALLTSYYRHIDLANASLHELEKLSHFCRHYEVGLPCGGASRGDPDKILEVEGGKIAQVQVRWTLDR